MDLYYKLLKCSNNFVNLLYEKSSKKTLLAGFSSTETCSSLIYQYINETFNNNNNNKPKNYLEEYFINQEHFSIFRFFKKVLNSKYQNKESISNKWIIFTRSLLSTSFKDIKPLNSFLGEELVLSINKFQLKNESYRLKDYDSNQKGIIKLIQLNSIKSCLECSKLVESFKISNKEKILIVTVDMINGNQTQVNYVLELLNDMNKGKSFFIIYYYPPEYPLSNQLKLNPIFLNEIDSIYIDSLGIRFDEENQVIIEEDIREWIAISCGISIGGGDYNNK
ncbi:hypothetical protein ACTFIY_005434 [Dictyostelium cf. discoideum]